MKPAIGELCDRENLRVLMDESNLGCITVLMGTSNERSETGSRVIM